MAKFILGSHLPRKAVDNAAVSRALWLVDLAFVGALVLFFRAMPLGWASVTGARFGRLMGRAFAGRTRLVRANLSRALPEKSPAEIERLTGDVWANAGGVLAEYPHLRKFTKPARGLLQIETEEPDPPYCKPGHPVVFVAAHLGNWEVACAAMTQLGIRSHALFAPLSNPWLDRIMLRYRHDLGTVPVSREAGLRGFMNALKAGEAPAMIIDRKVNDGIPVPFLGADKPSSVLPARLALRFEVPLVPVRVTRVATARYRVRFHTPLVPADPDADLSERARDLTCQIHAKFEDWIRERPGEWLCTSKIWPRAILLDRADEYTR